MNLCFIDRHTAEMIERLKVAGLGYKVSAEDTQEKLGKWQE